MCTLGNVGDVLSVLRKRLAVDSKHPLSRCSVRAYFLGWLQLN